jgi:hypothetical protein
LCHSMGEPLKYQNRARRKFAALMSLPQKTTTVASSSRPHSFHRTCFVTQRHAASSSAVHTSFRDGAWNPALGGVTASVTSRDTGLGVRLPESGESIDGDRPLVDFVWPPVTRCSGVRVTHTIFFSFGRLGSTVPASSVMPQRTRALKL